MRTKRTQTVWWINEQAVARGGRTHFYQSQDFLLVPLSRTKHTLTLLPRDSAFCFILSHSLKISQQHRGGDLEYHHHRQQGCCTLSSEATPSAARPRPLAGMSRPLAGCCTLSKDATPSSAMPRPLAGMPHPPAAMPSSLYP